MLWFEWLIAIAIGALAGYVACRMTKTEGKPLFYIILGGLGAIVGAVIRWLITTVLNSWLGTLVMAILGALLLISFAQGKKKK